MPSIKENESEGCKARRPESKTKAGTAQRYPTTCRHPTPGLCEEGIAMDSPPADNVFPKGVAAIVHDLVEFPPVQQLFQTHLELWQNDNAQFTEERRKVQAELATFWRDEPQAADSFRDEHWPARRIYSPDGSKSGLFPIPPELNDRLNKFNVGLSEFNDTSRYHLVRSLENKQDFSTTESFVMLAELHDAAYPRSPIGYPIDHIVSVAEAANLLNKGMSKVAAQNLAILVERVLDMIESGADIKARNEAGKTLQEIVFRCRETLANPDTRSRPNFAVPQLLESVQDAIAKLGSDNKATLERSKPAGEREIKSPPLIVSSRKKPRGSKAKADTLIQKVLSSGNSQLIREWVFANEDQLAELCGCSRGTIMKTEFWKKDRASAQQKWARESGGRHPKWKSET